jgi:hypothetical protein
LKSELSKRQLRKLLLKSRSLRQPCQQRQLRLPRKLSSRLSLKSELSKCQLRHPPRQQHQLRPLRKLSSHQLCQLCPIRVQRQSSKWHLPRQFRAVRPSPKFQ